MKTLSANMDMFPSGKSSPQKAAENNGSLSLTTKALEVFSCATENTLKLNYIFKWNEYHRVFRQKALLSGETSFCCPFPPLILSLRVQIYTCCSVWFPPGLSQEGSRAGGMSWVHLETWLSSAGSPMAALLIYRHCKGNSSLIYQPIPCLGSKFNPKAAQFQQSCQYNVLCSAALLTFFDIMGSSLICNETLWINQCVLIHEVFFFIKVSTRI